MGKGGWAPWLYVTGEFFLGHFCWSFWMIVVRWASSNVHLVYGSTQYPMFPIKDVFEVEMDQPIWILGEVGRVGNRRALWTKGGSWVTHGIAADRFQSSIHLPFAKLSYQMFYSPYNIIPEWCLRSPTGPGPLSLMLICIYIHVSWNSGRTSTTASGPDHTNLSVRFNPEIDGDYVWEIDVGPPLFTLLQLKILTEGVRIG